MPIDFVADEDKIDFQPEEPEFQAGLVGPKERRFSMYDVPALVDKLSESPLPTYGMDVPTESVPVALAKTVAGLGKGVVSPLGAAATAAAPIEAAAPALRAGFGALGTKGVYDIALEQITRPEARPKTIPEAVELAGKVVPQLAMAAAPFIPEVTAAAYKNPKTGEVTAGSFHKEAAAEQGVKAPEAKEARETPDYGFIVQDPKTGATEFKTRPETEPIAQASGQLVQEPERTGQPHSDDIAAPGTDTPIAETKVPEDVKQNPVNVTSSVPIADESIQRSLDSAWEAGAHNQPMPTRKGLENKAGRQFTEEEWKALQDNHKNGYKFAANEQGIMTPEQAVEHATNELLESIDKTNPEAGHLLRVIFAKVRNSESLTEQEKLAVNKVLGHINNRARQIIDFQVGLSRTPQEVPTKALKALREEGVTEQNAKAILSGTKTPDQVVNEQLGVRVKYGSPDSPHLIIDENPDGSRTATVTPDAGPARMTPKNIGQNPHDVALRMAIDQGVERINAVLEEHGLIPKRPSAEQEFTRIQQQQEELEAKRLGVPVVRGEPKPTTLTDEQLWQKAQRKEKLTPEEQARLDEIEARGDEMGEAETTALQAEADALKQVPPAVSPGEAQPTVPAAGKAEGGVSAPPAPAIPEGGISPAKVQVGGGKALGEMTPDEAIKSGADRGDYYREVESAFREGKISDSQFLDRHQDFSDKWPRQKVGDIVWDGYNRQLATVKDIALGQVTVEAKGVTYKLTPDYAQNARDYAESRIRAKQSLPRELADKFPDLEIPKSVETTTPEQQRRSVGEVSDRPSPTPPTLTPAESTRLKSLTEKMESGKPLTSAEQKRFRALKDKVSPPEGEKPSVEAEKPETEPTPTTQAAAPTLFVKQGNRMKQVSPEQASEAMGTLRRKLGGFSKGQLSSIPLYDIRGKEIGHVSPNGNVWFGKMDDPLKNRDLILNKTGLVRTPEGTWDLPKPPRWNELRDVQDKLDAFRKKHRERSLGSDSSLAATYPEFAKLIKQRDEILADTYGSGKPDVDVSSTKSPTTPPKVSPPEGEKPGVQAGDLGKLIEASTEPSSKRTLPKFSIPPESNLSEVRGLPFTEPQKEIVDRLVELGYNPKIRVVKDHRLPAASYNGSAGILLNAAKLESDPHLAIRGIVHEAVHDATHAAIRNPVNSPIVERLNGLMSYAMKTYYRNRTRFGGTSSTLDHAFKNVDEFVTGAFTSGRVRKVLSQMELSQRTGVKPTSTTATVFGRFIQLVSDLLGLKGKSTLLEEVVKSGEELIKSRTKPETPISFDATKIPTSKALEYESTTPPSTGERMAGPATTELYAGVPVGLDKFIESDLKPLLKKGVDATKALSDVVVNWFSPATHTKSRDVDVLFESKGYAEQFKTKAAAAVEQANKMVGSLPEKEQIDFIDRVKRGEKQATPELQTIADLLRKWDDRLYQEAKVYKPSLNYLDNHLRVLWKVIPGSPEAIGLSKTSIGSKRPWRGSQGFTRRHVLEDMSEGLDLGGVPVTYNPVEMFLLHAQDVMKFVSANRAWEALKKTGSLEFVREGKKPPEGFRRFDDPIAKPYFRTEEGLKAKPGEWWVDEGTARMLHNYLSRDYIRTGKFGPVGRGILALKNATTAIELGLSPFHAVFESNETMASSLGLGIAKMASGKAREGIKDIVSAGASPVTTAKLGGAAIRFAKDESAFAQNYPDAYKWFTQRYPEARQMIKDLFTGGGQVSMHEDYRIRARKGFEKAVAEGNYPGAVLRAIPALSELANKPLFETYIPRLKVGMFLREYAFELERNSADLASGKITREALARKTWSFIEDRFGELNWDNLYWDRTFKTAMQLMFRSVTWKLGNIRGFGKAGRDLWTEGVMKLSRGEMPRMTLPMAWVAGTALVTAIQSSIISKVSTGQYPWELAADFADLIKNLTFPRIDPKDPSQRVSIPTYLRDAVHMAHDPTGYVRSSMTGTWGRIADDWQNKDFYGRPVYNPLDPVQKRLAAQFEHLIPLPFAVSSYQAATKTGASTERALAGFAGFTKAPGYISPSASSQVYDMAEKWMASSKIPALEEKARRQAIKEERRADEPSAYQNLRSLLKAGDMQGAKEEYAKLLSAHKFVSIQNAMNPNRPFTGSFASEQKFKRSMTPAQWAIYDSAIDERKTVLKRFRDMTRSYHANRIRENP